MKKSKLLITTALVGFIPRAFENESGGWKMDGENPVFQDGNPVWVGSDGQEQVLKRDTVAALRNEAKDWRLKAEDNLTKLKPYEGLDAAAARDALDKLTKIDQKKLIESGEVDKLKDQIKGEYTGQLTEKETTIGKLQSRLNNMITESAFSNSKFIRENVAVPPDMFRATFANRFKVVDEKLEAYDQAGNRLMSKKNIGEYADFEESIQLLVDAYPQKDAILKAPDQRGSGSDNQGSQSGGVRTMTLANFGKLSPVDQAAYSALCREGKAKLID